MKKIQSHPDSLIMGPSHNTKPSILRNILVKSMAFCLLILCLRFAYVITLRGDHCDLGNFCFFPETLTTLPTTTSSSAVISAAVSASGNEASMWTTKGYREAVGYYSSVFQDLIAEGFLTPESASLCVESTSGHDIMALKELGISSAVGVAEKASKPLVMAYNKDKKKNILPFQNDAFEFVFYSGGLGLDDADVAGKRKKKWGLSEMAGEIGRTLKPEGYLVVHTKSIDTYSLHSFIGLFNCCSFIKSRDLHALDASPSSIREIVMKKELQHGGGVNVNSGNSGGGCAVPGYKQEIVLNAEPLIEKEPLKPWITLKKNIQNIKYLPSMVDISFKSRYIYIDVGARSYGSSIGSWFKKQYPKQNKTFEIFAIEADKSFHDEYLAKKKTVKLLPYAAWVRNETLFFEVNHDPGDDPEEKGKKGRGMGRIKPVQSDDEGHAGRSSGVDRIEAFDFAEWLKSTVTERDFVVMKMDIEGTEFDLIPRLIETGAICLIDEVFLECHYNRWQRCCPGQRSEKYEKTYGQCLDLFTSLRKSGVLVHQWW